MTVRTLVVVSAGLTQPSSTRLLADRLRAAVETDLVRLGIEPRTQLIELRQYGRDVMNSLLTGFPSGGLREVVETVGAADGLIAVTPIFNASYSGLFKSFVDILEDGALVDTPVLVAATGGTARHSLALEHALRPLFVYLHAVVMPTSVFASSEDWAGGTDDAGRTDDGGTAPLHARTRKAAAELAHAMSRREPRVPSDPFALTTSFDDLVGGP